MALFEKPKVCGDMNCMAASNRLSPMYSLIMDTLPM